MTKKELKAVARKAFMNCYGFAPIDKKIILLESGEHNGDIYILVKVDWHEYAIEYTLGNTFIEKRF